MRSTLIGQYEHSIDPKNRLFIPQKFREELGKEGKKHFVLTTVYGDCVSMFLPSDWEQALKKLNELNLPNKEEERAYKRRFLASAVEVEVDGQGRVLVPQLLKDKAELKKDVVINGAGNKIELWDAKKWAAFEKRTEPVLRKTSAAIDI